MRSKKASDVIKSHLEHQDTPTHKLAKYLHKRYPGLWESVERCRDMVRYYRGEQGPAKRKAAEKAGTLQIKIPAPKRKRKPTLRLRDKGRWLIIGDLHVPYHDARAIESAVRHGVDTKCEHLLVNGDALDAYQCSKWTRDPRVRHVDKEVRDLSELLCEIAPLFPGRKVYNIGNHEARIESYLFENAPRMIGISKWDLCKVLAAELKIDGWTMIDSKQLFKLGRLNGYHGHELPRGLTNPVSVGRGIWMRTRQSGFAGHWHKTSTHVETSGDKQRAWVCFSLGCLCDLHPDYAPVNDWNLGFATVDLAANGDFSEQNRRIMDGEIW